MNTINTVKKLYSQMILIHLILKKWKHDLTMSGGGNWEFQLYHNNRTNSFVKDGVLNILPTLTEDRIGQDNLKMNYRMDMWGGKI